MIRGDNLLSSDRSDTTLQPAGVATLERDGHLIATQGPERPRWIVEPCHQCYTGMPVAVLHRGQKRVRMRLNCWLIMATGKPQHGMVLGRHCDNTDLVVIRLWRGVPGQIAGQKKADTPARIRCLRTDRRGHCNFCQCLIVTQNRVGQNLVPPGTRHLGGVGLDERIRYFRVR